MEFEAEVEEQQHQTQQGEHLQLVRVVDQGDAGGVRTEQYPGQDEKGDRGEPDAAAQAGEDGCGQEGPAHREEGFCVSDGSSRGSAGRCSVKGESRKR